MPDWESIRKKFPALNNYIYLNCAEGSPISSETAQSAMDYYIGMRDHGDLIYETWLEQASNIRKLIADYISAEPEEIVFTTNTSTAMNIISQMLKGQGNVLTMDGEFPSSTLPWIHNSFQIDFVKPVEMEYPIDHIESYIKDTTKILVSSHIQYATGFRQDIQKLSEMIKKRDLYFVLNATQSFGVFPIDVKKMKIDFLCATGLKWAMSGYGIAILYISKEMQSKFRFPLVGWKSVFEPNLMDNKSTNWKKNAQVLEVGCLHFPNIFALGATFKLFQSIGQENISNRLLELTKYAIDKLINLNAILLTPVKKDIHRSGIIIIKVNNPDEMKNELRKKNIIVSKRGGGIRISCHIFNSFKDLDTCIEAIKPFLV